MSKFEIMKVTVPLSLEYRDDAKPEEKKTLGTLKLEPNRLYVKSFTPADGELTTAAWAKAAEFAEEGWELVGAIPLIAYSYTAGGNASLGIFPRDLSNSYTAGYELLFKRRLSPDQ